MILSASSQAKDQDFQNFFRRKLTVPFSGCLPLKLIQHQKPPRDKLEKRRCHSTSRMLVLRKKQTTKQRGIALVYWNEKETNPLVVKKYI